MFLFEEEKIENFSQPKPCVYKIYTILKEITGIKNINIDKWDYGNYNDDGRKKITARISVNANADISKIIADVFFNLEDIYDIKISRIIDEDREDFCASPTMGKSITPKTKKVKEIELCFIKKYASDDLEKAKLTIYKIPTENSISNVSDVLSNIKSEVGY